MSDLDELAFLNEIARLATLARDWDELMRSIVDGTTAAMGVEVCSFYLADTDRTRLTLAATNGLDRSQVGKVSLAWGQGITGRVAETRTPIAVEDVTRDDRFAWVRGFDIEDLRGMLSVPLVWHDDVVGVLNVQTRADRRFTDDEIRFLGTIAALLAGIVEKGRLTAEVEARLAELTALDAARSELLSVVTHELRTPLSVVRVYVDLLTEAAGPEPPDAADPEAWRAAAVDQLGRLDRLVDSILASVRGEGLTGLSRAPFDAIAAVDETVETLASPPPAATHPLVAAGRAADRGRRRDPVPPGHRTAARERIEVRAVGRGREHRRLAGRRRGPDLRHRRRPGRADRGLGERLRAVRPDRRPGPVARFGHRAVRLAPADDRDGRPDLPRAERLREQPVRGGVARLVLTARPAGVYIASRYTATRRTQERQPMTTVATSTPAVGEAAVPDSAAISPWRGITRDIARGGLTGAIVGLVGCGLGGRLVMRLAALLVPEARGAFTENGNQVGVITLDGSSFLIIAGLFIGLLGGTIWVAISPWIPGTGLRRALVTVPIAIGLGAAGLVDGDNSDFAVLGHNGAVVASLLGLVALIGLAFALVDSWLDRHLPPPNARWTVSSWNYVILSLIGALIVVPMVILAYASSPNLATVIQGILLVRSRRSRSSGGTTVERDARSARRACWLAGRTALVVAVAFGYVTLVPDVVEALGA